MTETLQHLLHDRADHAALEAIDLDAISRAGGRRVRRRRRLVAGAAAGLVAVAAAGVTVLGGGHDREPAFAPPHVVSDTPSGISWAEGSVIHDGATTIDVGHTVSRYVATAAGYVFTDQQSQVWSAHDGTVEKVGTTFGPLVSDPDGTLAGWADTSSKLLVYTVLDQATGVVAAAPGQARRLAVAPGLLLEGGMVGADGDRVAWRDKGTYVVAHLTAEGTLQTELAASGPAVVGLGAGLVLEANRQSGQVTAVRSDGTVSLGTPNGSALVAPDGEWVAFGEGDASEAPVLVYDTRTGHPVSLDVDAFRALPTQWLDADTVVLLVAPTEDTDYQLWSCTLPSGGCAIAVADLGSGPTTSRGNGLRFALPIGDYWFPYPHG